MADLTVTKRNGTVEPLDINKIHSVVFWATEGITGVSVSDLEMKAKLQFSDKMLTKDIQQTLIKAAADLITEQTPNYQYVAARLIIFDLRKECIGQFEPIHINEIINRGTELGLYDEDLCTWYTEEEWDKINSWIKHDRDYNFTYASMKQLTGKYLIQDRKTKRYYETPQYLYMLISATMFHNFDPELRMNLVKQSYEFFSSFDISLPTPIMAGVRSAQKQYASCVTLDAGDTLNSIDTTASCIVKYISRKAGIGINGGRIRALDSKIGKGHAVHTGVIPFYRYWQSAVKSCSQGGERGGAATLSVPIWHLEIEDILVLKNNKGTEDNRVRRIDYCIQFSRLMYERYKEDGVITLFTPHEVPDLYEAFFTDQDEFKRLYERYERSRTITKKTISAKKLFHSFMLERTETGRLYYMNTDHANDHSSFNVPIYMTNLCVEITLPTKPLEYINDPNGMISLCILAAINMGTIKHLDELEEKCKIAVFALDELIDYQEYPIEAARTTTLHNRALGVGVINLAYYIAKHGHNYSDGGALRLVHEFFEAMQFYLIKASVELAKIKGPCQGFSTTKYSQGILPIDTYKKSLDEIVDPTLNYDWESLRADVLQYGMRNCTLSALMPAETSAQILNGTNGIEPAKSLVVVKGSKQSAARQVVPEIQKLKNVYESPYDMSSMDGYIKLVGVMQKFVDQSISANTYYDPENFRPNEDGEHKIPMSVLIEDMFKCYKYGWKTAYYSNVNDNRSEEEKQSSVVSDNKQPIISVIEDDDCDSCKI